MAIHSGSTALSLFRDHQTDSSTTTTAAPLYNASADRTRTVSASLPRPSRPEIDVRLIEIVDGARLPGETITDQFRRKEHELGSVFGTLTELESFVMHKRLTIPKPGDEVAAKFSRLVVERKHRLLSFLRDARRRAAVGK